MQADGRVVIDTKINTDGVVAGEAEVAAGLQQNPFQSGNGAFGRYCSGCGGDGGL